MEGEGRDDERERKEGEESLTPLSNISRGS